MPSVTPPSPTKSRSSPSLRDPGASRNRLARYSPYSPVFVSLGLGARPREFIPSSAAFFASREPFLCFFKLFFRLRAPDASMCLALFVPDDHSSKFRLILPRLIRHRRLALVSATETI
jgi:hypothetical protein